MPTLAEALAQGQKFHQAGDLPRAEQLYRQVLHSDASQGEVWYLLGAACQAQGKLAEAVGHYRQALALRPDLAAAHNSLGIALVMQRDLAGAVASFRRAVRLRPDHAQAHSNLGNALKEQGQFDDALPCYEQAIRLKPDFAEAHSNLGSILGVLGRFPEAESRCREALRLKPTSAEAHNNLGIALAGQNRLDEALTAYQEAIRLRPDYPEAYNNLGVLYADQRKHAEAVDALRQAVRLRPDYAEALGNLGGALSELGQFEEALGYCREAVRLNPERAGGHTALAMVLAKLGKLDEAEAGAREAVRRQPDSAEAYNALGLILADQGRHDEALAAYQKAIDLKPHSAEAHRNRALLWLLLGNLEQGWKEFEWRWECKELPRRPFRQPEWDGGPLGGKTVLLHAEQGLGDTLHFVRYAPLVKARGGVVVLACQRALIPLLSRCPGIDRLVAQGDVLPAFDVHAALLSLPRIFGTTLTTIPAEIPYLQADPRLVATWRPELEAGGGFKVGVVWQGSSRHRKDHHRSFPLALLEPVARVPGVRLFSLQKGAGAEQLGRLGGRFAVTDLGSRLDETAGPFLDSAAVLTNLDLLVTCDSSLGHLAGALGTPTWLALMFEPDWRWLLGRPDTPWYPRHRLFRQDRPGDWEGVFRRLATALATRVGKPAGPRPITVEIAPGELLDKITILQIKSERIGDPAKRANVAVELATLNAARAQALPGSADLARLEAELKRVNEALWDIEDAIRQCERARDFGPRFIELARSVYRTNDRRAAVKRQVNELLGSRLVEEKAYVDYDKPSA